jgi:hypothetical protein
LYRLQVTGLTHAAALSICKTLKAQAGLRDPAQSTPSLTKIVSSRAARLVGKRN